MAGRVSTSVVKDGLILYLDAANIRSYPGSGSSWLDLTKSKRNGSLVSTSYSSSNGGNISFNGSTSYVSMPFVILASNSFTIDMWCLPTSTHEIDPESTSAGFRGTTGQKYVFNPVNGAGNASAGISLGTNGCSVYEHGNSYMPAVLVHSGSFTTFTHFVVTYTSLVPRLYVNGVLVRTGITGLKSVVYLYLSDVGRGDYGYYAGGVSSMRLYDRSLSASEILQNYNATKSKFGL
jgi:hypothetical protein